MFSNNTDKAQLKQTRYLMQGMISDLSEDEQNRIKQAKEKISNALAEDPEAGYMALMLLSIEESEKIA